MWRKQGLLYAPQGERDWMGTYATLPVVNHIDGDRFRIFLSGRDSGKRAHPGYVEIDITNPPKILSISKKPLLVPGPSGTFEDAGVYFSWLAPHNSEKYMYYIGWNLGVKVPFRIAIGLAISKDDGKTFKRYAPGPILDRGPYDAGFVGSCCVLPEGDRWRMWYVSCTGWELVDGKMRHNYHIKYAESRDGINWQRDGIVSIDFASKEEYAIARPCVIKENGLYKMWYCYRGDYYRIGYAESKDGISWERKDGLLGLDVSETGWDSEMVAYPFVFDHKGTRYMLYNGNGYGKTGLGYAIFK
ncbi:hypothetical protein A2115_03110 [Candidatus Woesebacteria bacterium GWA1_41_8]|uniref:Glycosyl hydrolase family 32 N-terminal domain-containing protein n=1 Tax=Candidatus Woesebacteria bacterium GWA1_41_8 TaxID=1802471 RepID=A0A1F7WHW1_9BACT|nr:MAG: hypothetical protein A2115_03110 [Candidatus Woesebacteria bacterium GWA1_41_8]